MDFTNIFVILFLVGTLSDFLLDQILELVNFIHRKKHGAEIPETLQGLESLQGHIEKDVLEKTVAYKNARYKLWLPRHILSTGLTLILVLCGFYPMIFSSIQKWTGNVYLASMLFMLLSSLPDTILDLPFSLIREFKIEKDFGFSKMTFRMWISDAVKSAVVSLVVAVPLICAAIFLLSHASSWWWILLGAVYVAFSFLISYLYPVLIAPVFNKFTPLEEGELKQRLESLMEKTGFHAKSIFIMDASKRSGHSNAYFTGLGKNKRIVLYDTLVNQLSTDEIEAVLAHELGHYKHRHIIKRQCVTIPLIFAALFAISMLIKNPQLYSGFGFLKNEGTQIETPLLFIGLFLAFLSFGSFAWIPSLIGNATSRRDEFQADAFSAKICGSGKNLISALIKLNKENLSEICPPKIYCLFNYDHPPLTERIRSISNPQNTKEET